MDKVAQDAYMTGYEAGAEYALRLYAYSSSATWAENGVQYVGTTGTKLAEALARLDEHVDAMRATSGVPRA